MNDSIAQFQRLKKEKDEKEMNAQKQKEDARKRSEAQQRDKAKQDAAKARYEMGEIRQSPVH